MAMLKFRQVWVSEYIALNSKSTVLVKKKIYVKPVNRSGCEDIASDGTNTVQFI